MDSIFNFTGNPFVDGGVWGIMSWLGKKKTEDIVLEELIEEFEDITDLYTTPEWKKLMYYLYPNNPLINPSFSGKHKEKYLEYLHSLVNQINRVNMDGSCISCGIRGVMTPAKRNDIPLTGSGTLKNYFSYASEGADYCPVCTLAIQFLPLVLYICGGKVILISSHSKKIMRRWAQQCNNFIKDQIMLKSFQVGINEGYTVPQNSLFHITSDFIIKNDASEFEGEKNHIRLYYFTNYGQSADIEFYDLPSKVFTFYVYLKQSGEYNKWLEVVNRGFYKKTEDEEDMYKKYSNQVYNNLLNEKSIIGYFTDNHRQVYGTWNILHLYLKEVISMDEYRIQLIKELGDKIANCIKKRDNLKRLTSLEMANSYNDFMNVIRIIAKDRIRQREEEPLIKLDEYVDILYKDNYANWREVRDLLLFRIYENLHDYLVGNEEYKEEEEEE